MGPQAQRRQRALVNVDKNMPVDVEVVTLDEEEEDGDPDDIQMVGEEYKTLYQCKFCRTFLFNLNAHDDHVTKKHPHELEILAALNENRDNDDGEFLEDDMFFQFQKDQGASAVWSSIYKVSRVGQRGPKRPRKTVSEVDECSSLPSSSPSELERERSRSLELWAESQSQIATTTTASSLDSGIIISSLARNTMSVSQAASVSENEGDAVIQNQEKEGSIPPLINELDPEEWPSLEEANKMSGEVIEEDGDDSNDDDGQVAIAITEPFENAELPSVENLNEEEFLGAGTPNSNATTVTLMQVRDIKQDPDLIPPSPHKKLPRKYVETVSLSDSEDEDPKPKKARWSLRSIRRAPPKKDSEQQAQVEPTAKRSRKKVATTNEKVVRKRATKTKLGTDPTLETPLPANDLPTAADTETPLENKPTASDRNSVTNQNSPSTSPINKNFKCTFCFKLFSRERTLAAHVTGMHRDEI